MAKRFLVKIGKSLNKIYILLSQVKYIVYRTFLTTYIVNW